MSKDYLFCQLDRNQEETSLVVIGCVLAVARDCVPGCEEAEIVRVTGITSINLQGETFPCSCAPVLKLILYLVD